MTRQIVVTDSEIEHFQENHWVTYCSQNGVCLQCNLLGNWRVSGNYTTSYLSLQGAKEGYILRLQGAGVPHHRQSVEFQLT